MSTSNPLCSLHDDCWYQIIALLDLSDQLALFQASSSFAVLLADYWQMHYKKLVLNFYECHLSLQEFEIIISSIHRTVEKIILKFFEAKHWQVLKNYCFPQVHDLRFTQLPPNRLGDDTLLCLPSCFPNLKTFSPQGRFTGKHIENISQLEHLTLTWCVKIKYANVKEILQRLKLKTLKLNTSSLDKFLPCESANISQLQTLILNSDELALFMSDCAFKQLNSLQRLVITDITNEECLQELYNFLNAYKCENITSIETRLYAFEEIERLHLFAYTNLQVLSFVNIIVDLGKLYALLQANSKLQSILFRSCVIEKATMLQIFLEQAKCLHKFSAEDCRLDCRQVTLNIEHIMYERDCRFNLNVFENYYCDINNSYARCDVQLQLKSAHKLFFITQKLTPDITYEPLNIGFCVESGKNT